MIGEIISGSSPTSTYQPSSEVAEITNQARRNFARGLEILNRPSVELNNYSVVDRMNRDQRTFNSFVDESNEDPNEAWKWKGTRGLARNKAMAMHAHLTAQFIVPSILAQNENQQEDVDMSDAMHDIVEWMTVNSNYRPAFLLVTMGALVNPITYLEADYCEVMQKIKERDPNTGAINTKEIIDEVLSGFQSHVLSGDQVLITNAYEQDVQRQYTLIKRRFIEYPEAKQHYGDHPNFDCVKPGIKSIYNDADGVFYDVYDPDHQGLVEEDTVMCRKDDTEIVFLGGIYMGDIENVEANPMNHRDNRNAPKYPIAPFGYERIGEHYFYYKSLINRVGWDDQLMDAMWAVHMNRGFLDLEMPVAISGADKIDTSVIFPGGQVANANPEFKITPILPPRTPNSYKDLEMIEGSMSDASISNEMSGGLPQASQRAYTIAMAAQNAKIILEGAAKTLVESVRQYGELMVDIALHHLTVPELDELTDMLKYRNFVLENQVINGKKVSKELRFDEALIGRQMSHQDRKAYRMKLLKEVGYPDNKKAIYVINPLKFSKMKYLVRMDTDTLTPRTQEYQQGIMERLYGLLRNDPLADPEALLRKLLHSFFRTGAEELMSKQPKDVMGQGQPQGAPQGMPQEGGGLAIPQQTQISNNRAIARKIVAQLPTLQ